MSFQLLLPSIFVLLFFAVQIPSKIAGMPASVDSGSFSADYPILADALNFTKLDNNTRTLFDKMFEMAKNSEYSHKYQVEWKNETLKKEAIELADKLFDAADENKDGLLDQAEIAEIIMELFVYYIEKSYKEKKIDGDWKMQKNLTEEEQKIMKMISESIVLEIRKDAKNGAIYLIKEWDLNGDGKVSKNEMKAKILANMESKETSSTKKFKSFAEMKIGMQNAGGKED